MKIVDSWTGGSSLSVLFEYRVVELDRDCYELQARQIHIGWGDENTDDFFVVASRNHRHKIALKLMDILRDEYMDRARRIA